MTESVRKNYHFRMDVKSALKKPDRYLNGILEMNGKPMPANLVRKQLQIHLSHGREYLPVGDCDNWDAEQQICGGHHA